MGLVREREGRESCPKRICRRRLEDLSKEDQRQRMDFFGRNVAQEEEEAESSGLSDEEDLSWVMSVVLGVLVQVVFWKGKKL